LNDDLLETALQLAKSGECADVAAVRARLRQAGFDQAEVAALTPDFVLELGRCCRRHRIRVRGRPLPGAGDGADPGGDGAS